MFNRLFAIITNKTKPHKSRTVVLAAQVPFHYVFSFTQNKGRFCCRRGGGDAIRVLRVYRVQPYRGLATNV